MENALTALCVGPPDRVRRRHREVHVVAGTDRQMMRLHSVRDHRFAAVLPERNDPLAVMLTAYNGPSGPDATPCASFVPSFQMLIFRPDRSA